MSAATAPPAAGTAMFTCMTCSIAYTRAEEQREHFRSEFHRYNMKRRIADLAPIKLQQFDEKVSEHKEQIEHAAQAQAENSGRCDVCRKSFSSLNAYRDHMQSKKHRENLAKPRKKPITMTEVAAALPDTDADAGAQADADNDDDDEDEEVDPDDEAAVERAAERKIARARRIDPAHECIFCGAEQPALEESLAHMSHAHGFFVPERKYLVDLPGLLGYLADKVAVGNICLWCNGRGRGFHELSAVRKHMLDKSHCKVAYESNEDQLELADFYDFRASYPDYKKRSEEADEWEDASDDGADDGEVVWEDDDESDADDADEDLPTDNGIRYGDSQYELVLPSGARLGHRSLQRYYRQTLWQTPAARDQAPSATNARALAHRLADQQAGSALVVKDRGGREVTARNRGEAREATRHIREFRDMQRKEAFRTKVAYRHNNQKHFRDPLLQ
ncbi:pre-60S factor rei1 [Malassezia cuniculi]|uniref:Pre-60S factor rei1 n=1 Tax=Malassezia cuniculi TaxID=948313 RepID=A0AAF0ESW5_9BASI|nr:pre-60S factor rei1 [Malassezia cuniculi]